MSAIKTLCFDPADDVLLARGYPHLARLVDGHADDRKPAAAALKVVNRPASIHARYRIDWPRKVAEHFVRAARSKEFQAWTNMEVPAAAVAQGGPVLADEARELLHRTVATPGCTFLARYESLVYVLEAMVGTEVVVEAILEALEALPDARWLVETSGPDRKGGGMAFVLGFLFLRVAPERAADQRDRLRRLYERVRVAIAAVGKSESWELTNGVEMVCEGSKARKCQSPGPYTYLDRYIFADDDLDLLRRVLGSKDTVYSTLDVRFVYHLGPEALTLMKKAPMAAYVPAFLTDIGMIRAPEVLDKMVELFDKSSAKGIPAQWLRAHADYARPILQSRKSERATMALAACG